MCRATAPSAQLLAEPELPEREGEAEAAALLAELLLAELLLAEPLLAELLLAEPLPEPLPEPEALLAAGSCCTASVPPLGRVKAGCCSTAQLCSRAGQAEQAELSSWACLSSLLALSSAAATVLPPAEAEGAEAEGAEAEAAAAAEPPASPSRVSRLQALLFSLCSERGRGSRESAGGRGALL
jgi:hypothetical protein